MKKKIMISGFISLVFMGYLALNLNLSDKQHEKNKPEVKKQYAVMVYDDAAESYIEKGSIPIGNYKIDEEKTYCENGGTVKEYDSENGTVKISSKGQDTCFLYFENAYTPPSVVNLSTIISKNSISTSITNASTFSNESLIYKVFYNNNSSDILLNEATINNKTNNFANNYTFSSASASNFHKAEYYDTYGNLLASMQYEIWVYDLYSKTYVKQNVVPTGLYSLNTAQTFCENGGTVQNYNSTVGSVSITNTGYEKCYIYFASTYVPPSNVTINYASGGDSESLVKIYSVPNANELSIEKVIYKIYYQDASFGVPVGDQIYLTQVELNNKHENYTYTHTFSSSLRCNFFIIELYDIYGNLLGEIGPKTLPNYFNAYIGRSCEK